jgi:hypothetical protein
MERSTAVAGLILSLLLVAWPAVARAQDTAGIGSVAGVVFGADGKPAAGIAICIEGTGRCAASASDGAFTISNVRVGLQHIEVRAPDLPPYRSGDVEVRAGFETKVEVALPQIDAVAETVTVTAPAFTGPEEVKTSGFVLSGRDIKMAAGALQDVSRYAQSLPGVVVGSNDFRNDLIVRGGSPLENLFVVDNIEIPNINAFATSASAGGSVGLIDASLIRNVSFLTGGHPAPFGNRVSSVMQVNLQEGSRDRVGGMATVGFLGAGGVLEGPLAGGKGSWVVSARRSFLDVFTDDVGVGGVPVIYAVNAKVVYDLTDRDRVWFVSITGKDDLRLGATASSTSEDSELATLDIRYGGWRTAAGLNWQRVFGDRSVGLLGITYSSASVDSTYKDLLRAPAPPAGSSLDDLIASAPVIFSEDSVERETTVKYDFTGVGFGWVRKVQVGGAVKRIDASYDLQQPYGYDNPYSPTPGGDPLALDARLTSYDLGGYVQGTWDLGARASLTAGGRIDHYGYTSDTRVSPRAGLSYRLTDRLVWQTSAGVYFQQTSPVLLAAFPGNGLVRPLRADHVISGLAFTPDPSLRVSVEFYDKQYREYPVSAEYPPVTLANIGDTFDVRESLFPLRSEGKGEAIGVELAFEKRFAGRWFGQGNVAFSRTRHAGLDGVLRPGAFDYPFATNLVGGYRLNDRWELAGRASYLTGRPYTPFDEATSTAQRRGVYDLTRVNAERATAYVRIDVRADYTIIKGAHPLIVFGGVQNLLNRKNFADYSWDRVNGQVRYQEQQGAFPLIGAEWRF